MNLTTVLARSIAISVFGGFVIAWYYEASIPTATLFLFTITLLIQLTTRRIERKQERQAALRHQISKSDQERRMEWLGETTKHDRARERIEEKQWLEERGE